MQKLYLNSECEGNYCKAVVFSCWCLYLLKKAFDDKRPNHLYLLGLEKEALSTLLQAKIGPGDVGELCREFFAGPTLGQEFRQLLQSRQADFIEDFDGVKNGQHKAVAMRILQRSPEDAQCENCDLRIKLPGIIERTLSMNGDIVLLKSLGFFSDYKPYGISVNHKLTYHKMESVTGNLIDLTSGEVVFPDRECEYCTCEPGHLLNAAFITYADNYQATAFPEAFHQLRGHVVSPYETKRVCYTHTTYDLRNISQYRMIGQFEGDYLLPENLRVKADDFNNTDGSTRVFLKHLTTAAYAVGKVNNHQKKLWILYLILLDRWGYQEVIDWYALNEFDPVDLLLTTAERIIRGEQDYGDWFKNKRELMVNSLVNPQRALLELH